jgi:hypothetical protein
MPPSDDSPKHGPRSLWIFLAALALLLLLQLPQILDPDAKMTPPRVEKIYITVTPEMEKPQAVTRTAEKGNDTGDSTQAFKAAYATATAAPLSRQPTATFTPRPPTPTRGPTRPFTPLCPPTGANIKPADYGLNFDSFGGDASFIDYLNAGGQIDKIPLKYRPLRVDLTNDGVFELVDQQRQRFHLLVCNNLQYHELLTLDSTNYGVSPEIVAIKDTNGNHVPEIIIRVAERTMAATDYRVFEWETNRFRKIEVMVGNIADASRDIDGPGPFDAITYRPVEGSNRFDILFHWKIAVMSSYTSFLPWREQTDFYQWQGTKLKLYRSEYGSPVYRFQAVQDGDQFLVEGDLDRAMVFYRQAIFDEGLEWWSPERRFVEKLRPDSDADPLTPTPTLPPIDPAEYPNLAAYARYRILLVYALNGWAGEAEAMLVVLREKFPAGQPGGQYTELAQAFWEAYSPRKSIAEGCSAANAFAALRGEEMWQYIGYTGSTNDGRFGRQGRFYAADAACPFTH